MLLLGPMVITMLCFVTITVTGAPTVVDSVLDLRSNANSQTNSTRAAFVLPTIPQLTKNLQLVVPPDKSLFYSGPGPSSYTYPASIYAKRYDLRIMTEFADPKTVEIVTDAGKVVETEYWRRMSAAFAYASRGRVYVMLPGETSLGTNWFRGTIWDTVEWPVLQENAEVADIFRIGRSLEPPSSGVSIKPQWSTPPRRSE